MASTTQHIHFPTLNSGYNATFKTNKLSLGLAVPIENNGMQAVPTMAQHIERVQLAESLGFAAVWLRDVPFNVPSFGDAGQLFDPFVYLGFLAAHTQYIALGVASIVLPLRHPAHVAKAAASADVLSGGRLLLGVASGDRPEEYPALALAHEDRGQRFRDSVSYIERMADIAPSFSNHYGSPSGAIDMLPKPVGGKLPLLITGASQQSPQWLAANGDGWITYPRNIDTQAKLISLWRKNIRQAGHNNKPVTQSLYIDLLEDDNAPPQPIHLGFRSGIDYLRQYLTSLKKVGINHVALNLRFNQADTEKTLRYLSDKLLPEFPSTTHPTNIKGKP